MCCSSGIFCGLTCLPRSISSMCELILNLDSAFIHLVSGMYNRYSSSEWSNLNFMYDRNFMEFRALSDQSALYILIKHNFTCLMRRFAFLTLWFFQTSQWFVRNNNDLINNHLIITYKIKRRQWVVHDSQITAFRQEDQANPVFQR